MVAFPAATPTPSLDAIEHQLATLIAGLEQIPSPRGRPQILSTGLFWGAVFVNVLRGTPTQRAIYRTATGTGVWSHEPVNLSEEGVRKRLVAQDSADLEAIVTDLTAHLTDRWSGDTSLVPYATGGVYALDDTTLDKVARTLTADDATTTRPLAGRLHTVFDLRRQCFQTVIPTDLPYENERVAAPDLIARLPERSLVVIDRGYLSFKLYDDITDGHRFCVTRLSDTITFTTTHVLTETDRVTDVLGFLGSYRADRSKHAYRLMTIRTAMGTRRYLTNVRKARRLTPAQIVALYARRWDIELAFKLIKRDLGLHLIWSTAWSTILLQIWATLLIAQVALVLRLKLALRAGVDLFDISLSLLRKDLPHYVARGTPDGLGAIADRGRYGGIIRPSRRVKLEVPTTLAVTPPPRTLQLIQPPRYAGKK